MPSSPPVSLARSATRYIICASAERDHGEIDALAANGEPAGDYAEDRGGRRTDDNGEPRRHGPALRGVGREIAGPTEIQRVAERQQSDIADQKVESASEQRKAQRLH